MYKEVELKFQVQDLGGVSSKILSCGYQILRPRIHELNVMYDNPQGLMQITDGRVRIRQSGDRIEFAYKKPITREGIKQEIEYETEVTKLEPLQKILEMMEFNPTTSYERYRTEYVKNGVKLTLDEYPFANYLEIEGDESLIIKEAKELGLDLKDNLTDSCDTLFTQWRKDRNLPPTKNMRFDDYER